MAEATTVWTIDQVMALAPDASAQRAARGLSGDAVWLETALSATDDVPPTVWGLCQGSGTKPYQTAVDLTDPAFRCTCPSRKLPCKHALGLLLRWSGGLVPDGAAPAWVHEWHIARAERVGRTAARDEPSRAGTTGTGRIPSEQAQARRADRIASGMDELDRWLADQVRTGLATVAKSGYAHWDTMAARLVDAQASSAAGILRRVSAVVGVPERLLGELSQLHLLAQGYQRLDELPAELAASLRMRVGLPTTTEAVLAGPALRDRWQIQGMSDEIEDNLAVRRTWLRGATTGRPALVLSFAVAGAPLTTDLLVGAEIDADLCFYPGGRPARAVVATRHGPLERIRHPVGGTGIEVNLRAHAEALADDPWLERWPMVLDAVVPTRAGSRWFVADAAGDGLPLARTLSEPWRLTAVAAGRPVLLSAEWTADGLRPLAVWAGGRLVRL